MPYISKKQLQTLREIAKTATMQNAGFGFTQEKFYAPLNSFGANVETNPDEFIKIRTQSWRNAWIVAPLEELIAEIEK